MELFIFGFVLGTFCGAVVAMIAIIFALTDLHG